MINFRRFYAGIFCALLFYQTAALAGPLKAWAYNVWWLRDGWRNAQLRHIDRLLFFELKVNSNGEIFERNGWPEKWVDLRLAVKQNKTPLDLTLTLFDPVAFSKLFNSAEATRRLLEECVALARQDGVAGLQLDFEIYTAIAPETLVRYRGFVRELEASRRQRSAN